MILQHSRNTGSNFTDLACEKIIKQVFYEQLSQDPTNEKHLICQLFIWKTELLPVLGMSFS